MKSAAKAVLGGCVVCEEFKAPGEGGCDWVVASYDEAEYLSLIHMFRSPFSDLQP